MDRREFVGNLVGSTVALNLLSIENNNKENPKKLPVVQFENGKISNYDEILAKIPWEKFEYQCDDHRYKADHPVIIRKCHCWVPKDDAFTNYSDYPRIWGEVELADMWHNNGFRYATLLKTPESIKRERNLHERIIHGNGSEYVLWQDQGVKVGVCHGS